MNINNNYYNLILIGHSGSGKTMIGKKISKILKKKFFDSDREIELLLNIDINKIFKIYGELFFRKKEKEILNNLLNIKNMVLSTGAGIIFFKENIKILKKIGILIYIKSDINECIKRIIDKNNRPLIKNINKNEDYKQYINILFKNREIIYEKISDISINSDGKSIDKIIDNIIYSINLNKYKYEKNTN